MTVMFIYRDIRIYKESINEGYWDHRSRRCKSWFHSWIDEVVLEKDPRIRYHRMETNGGVCEGKKLWGTKKHSLRLYAWAIRMIFQLLIGQHSHTSIWWNTRKLTALLPPIGNQRGWRKADPILPWRYDVGISSNGRQCMDALICLLPERRYFEGSLPTGGWCYRWLDLPWWLACQPEWSLRPQNMFWLIAGDSLGE